MSCLLLQLCRYIHLLTDNVRQDEQPIYVSLVICYGSETVIFGRIIYVYVAVFSQIKRSSVISYTVFGWVFRGE